MSLSAGMKLHGFTVNRVRAVAELSANLVEMSHDKTGAQLCWVEEDTGIFHPIAETRAWCWQQGCRLRWHPVLPDTVRILGCVLL